MSNTTKRAMPPVIVAMLTGLVVGVPAGYVGSAVMTRQPSMQQAETTSHDHAAMGHQVSDATRAFREASSRMHANMGDTYTGDVDLDFAHGMIPHHQGAVDMARIELEHGKDPAMRDLARKVMETQEQEMGLMHKWIDQHRSGHR